MLIKQCNSNAILARHQQKGVVLMLALVVLIAMTVAGLALIRSVGTANIIAGNLAFKQAATYAADRGVEVAINWIEDRLEENASNLNDSDLASGYYAKASADDSPYRGLAAQSWSALTSGGRTPVSSGTDATGNTVSYVIDRLCKDIGSPNAIACEESPVVSTSTGGSEEAGEIAVSGVSSAYYRITALAEGPRNTRSVVQVVIAK